MCIHYISILPLCPDEPVADDAVADACTALVFSSAFLNSCLAALDVDEEEDSGSERLGGGEAEGCGRGGRVLTRSVRGRVSKRRTVGLHNLQGKNIIYFFSQLSLTQR